MLAINRTFDSVEEATTSIQHLLCENVTVFTYPVVMLDGDGEMGDVEDETDFGTFSADMVLLLHQQQFSKTRFDLSPFVRRMYYRDMDGGIDTSKNLCCIDCIITRPDLTVMSIMDDTLIGMVGGGHVLMYYVVRLDDGSVTVKIYGESINKLEKVLNDLSEFYNCGAIIENMDASMHDNGEHVDVTDYSFYSLAWTTATSEVERMKMEYNERNELHNIPATQIIHTNEQFELSNIEMFGTFIDEPKHIDCLIHLFINDRWVSVCGNTRMKGVHKMKVNIDSDVFIFDVMLTNVMKGSITMLGDDSLTWEAETNRANKLTKEDRDKKREITIMTKARTQSIRNGVINDNAKVNNMTFHKKESNHDGGQSNMTGHNFNNGARGNGQKGKGYNGQKGKGYNGQKGKGYNGQRDQEGMRGQRDQM